jgi:cellulose synthase operon protein C
MRLSRTRTSTKRNPMRMLLLAAGLVVLLPGCKTPDFVSNRFDNFTAYYNTFYNAKEVFQKGYNNLTRTVEPVDRVRFLPIYPRTSGTGTREFDSAVLKSADLLRKHPDSKWVDDALLLIGKSYFYQENFVGATQKFREVIDLNTSLVDESVFWLARSLITSGALDLAEKELLFGLAREGVDKKWASQYSLLLGELKIKLSAWPEASDYLAAAIEEVKDKTVAGRAQFLLGQVYEQQGRFEEAVDAYDGVRGYRPTYELDYAARYSAIRVQGLHLDANEALGKLRKMERDDKNFSNLAELSLLKARIWQENGRDEEAFQTYEQLLYDPNPIGNAAQLKGRIHYALGELYRDIDRNFVMAAAHFDTAAASLETSTNARSRIRSSSYSATQVQYAPEAITDANQLKTSFMKFSRVFNDLVRYDSLLWLGEMPIEEYDAKILELRKKKAIEIAEQKRLLAERQRERAFETGIEVSDPFSTRGLPPGKIIPGLNDTEGTVDGYLFHKNPIRVQEGRANFEDVWGKRALAPNWRRSAVLSASTQRQSDEDSPEDAVPVEDLGDGELPEINTSDVPRDSTAQVEMRSQRAISRYELGNTLFLSMARPDSAAVWYRKVIEEDEQQIVAQRALYALAEVQRALGDETAANRIYRDILERFPDSDFSDDVRSRLGLEAIERAESDSSKLAINAYEAAYLFAKDAEMEEAINRYLEVASDWTKYDQSGKAQLGAATKHMEWAGADSAKIFTELPVTLPWEKMAKLWPEKYKWIERDSSLVVADVVPDVLPDVVPDVVPDGVPPMDAQAPVTPDSTSSTLPVEQDAAVPDSTVVNEKQIVAPDSTVVNDKQIVAPDSVSIDAPKAEQEAPVVNPIPQKAPVSVESPTKEPSGPVADVYTYTEAHEERAPLYVEDIYVKLASDYRGRALGLTAERTRKAIVERRTPPPKAKPDSLTLANERQARLDSLLAAGVSPDSMADSLGMAAIPDSMDTALSEIPADTTSAARVVPGAQSPVSPSSNEDDVFLTEDDEDSPSGARTSSNLKPLLPTGRPNMDALGWTVVLGTHITMEAAQADLRVQTAKLSAAGFPVYIFTNAEGERLEFLVGWGLFETKPESDEAIVKYGAFLPPRRSLLHLIPASSRTP